MKENRELLERLRAARIEKGLSYQSIVDLTEQNGEAVSLSTVRRVFAHDADAASFRADRTLIPLAHVLLTGHQEPEETPEEELHRLREEVQHLRAHEAEVLSKAQTMVQSQIDTYLSSVTAERRANYAWFKRRVVLILLFLPTDHIVDLIGLIAA